MIRYPLGFDTPTASLCSMSVVVPVFNEEAVLAAFHQRLKVVLAKLDEKVEVLYVDDGSSDGTFLILQNLQALEKQVSVVRLSRNFGKEQAMSAGLRLAQGDAVILIDVDLQDPPELIASMVVAWRDGADIVNMRRRSRAGESWFKKATAYAFYRVMNMLSEVPVPPDVGDFRLLDRRVVAALNLLPERGRFMKGLFAWVGFRQVTLDYDRAPRAAGSSKWRYWRLFNFAIEGITSFSTAPLKVATYVGLLSAALSFAYAVYFLVKTLLLGDSAQGFPTLIVCILLLGGLQLMAIGVLGEYLGRLFVEAKARPLYLIDVYTPAPAIASTTLPSPASVAR